MPRRSADSLTWDGSASSYTHLCDVVSDGFDQLAKRHLFFCEILDFNVHPLLFLESVLSLYRDQKSDANNRH